jgi:hypothetical protein
MNFFEERVPRREALPAEKIYCRADNLEFFNFKIKFNDVPLYELILTLMLSLQK